MLEKLLNLFRGARQAIVGVSLVETVMAGVQLAALGASCLLLFLCHQPILWTLVASEFLFHLTCLCVFGLMTVKAGTEQSAPAAA